MKSIRKRLMATVLAVGLLFTACGGETENSETMTEDEFAQTMLQEELTDAGLNDAQKESVLQVYEQLGGKPEQLTDLLYVPDESMLITLFDDFYMLQFTFDGDKVNEVSCEYSSERHYYLFYSEGEVEAEFAKYLVQANERETIQATILKEIQNYYPDATITESSRDYISYWHYDKYETIGEEEVKEGVVYYVAMASLDATFEEGTVKTLHVNATIKVEDGNWTIRSLWFNVLDEPEEELVTETITLIEELEE